MLNQIQYITNEKGEQIGVLLDMRTYQQLVAMQMDPDLLIGFNREELIALAASQLAPINQERLSLLLEKNLTDAISAQEIAELDSLLTQIDHLTTLKSRAKYTLHYLSQIDKAI